ncbi:MAG: zinc-ribbon domain-containing protein [Chloroflexi bacterium]|nr:zinc-ribbon domain-containing protein [Chloroflexota bacterium]
MLFIIFGTRVRHSVIGEGQFYCPKCQAKRAYKHKRASRYFTLYFVPLIPMGKMGEFIECQACGIAFETSVLQLKAPVQPRVTPANLAALINTLPTRLSTGTPVEYLVRDMTAAGLDRQAALDLITPHLTAGRKTCSTCGLSYAAAVSTCAECHQPV